MKKLLVSILVLTAIGTFGVNTSFAGDQEATPLETCETLAIEQNIAPEDIEQFVIDCLADLEGEQESNQDEELVEPTEEDKNPSA